MTTTPPENPGTQPTTPPENPPDSNPQPDTDAQTPADVRTQPPEQNKGSGQFAVWDADLGQFVSGVSSKADADKARKSLGDVNGAITDGHDLSVREV